MSEIKATREFASPACRPLPISNPYPVEGALFLSQNDHLDAAWQYHSGTKHSYLSIRMHPHILDWENKPLLFKIYPTLEVRRLPKDFRQTGVAALAAIAIPGVTTEEDAI